MAVTKLNQIRRRYNEQRQRLKEQYKEDKGLKIARGFPPKGSKYEKELRRINRNEYQALYRYDKRNQKERLKNPTVVRVLAVDMPHHTVLDYGGKTSAKRAVRDAFHKARQNRKGKAARLVIDSRFDDSGQSIYTNQFQADLALKDLYIACNNYQDITNEYVFCTLTTAETNKEFFITVIAKRQDQIGLP